MAVDDIPPSGARSAIGPDGTEHVVAWAARGMRLDQNDGASADATSVVLEILLWMVGTMIPHRKVAVFGPRVRRFWFERPLLKTVVPDDVAAMRLVERLVDDIEAGRPLVRDDPQESGTGLAR